ncbi:hypothetical protein A9264_06715 [Vibrio sp. UCD-FRSSP16_10]|nr:hypothetical protein A9264_06715 [Vibrio sp. UCD-FRSSP16_10]OBT17864.1 hypothetical protein A9260_00710 [Vibrio sp. UCD-FRSSP16_30]
MYLVKSPFGIYHFRFSVRISNRQYQPKLSLQTKCKKEAKYHSAIIAYHISLLTEVTVSSIKAIYSEYKANLSSKTKQAPVINSRAIEQVINKPESLPKDITNVLTDLSTKSKQEYQSCYNSFISKYLSCNFIRFSQ